MTPFLQNSMLFFGLEMEPGTLQSSRVPLGCGFSQTLFLTHQPPTLSVSGLIGLFVRWSKIGMEKGAKKMDRERPEVSGDLCTWDVQWWQRMTEVLADSCSANSVRPVLKYQRSQQIESVFILF